jgi:hypothetical protein
VWAGQGGGRWGRSIVSGEVGVLMIGRRGGVLWAGCARYVADEWRALVGEVVCCVISDVGV